MIFVAAAGNDGVNIDVQPFYPAAYALNNIISVGASDGDPTIMLFNFASNYGVKGVDLFAPGTYMLALIQMTFMPTWTALPWLLPM